MIEKTPVLEICVDTAAAALAAAAGGAQRIELCSSLSEGGITPSAGLMEVVVQQLAIPVHVLIRPRRGDFLYSDLEFSIMKKDIALAKKLDAHGIVAGILRADGHIDLERTSELIALSRPLSFTFHRAFDLCADPLRAFDELLTLGVDRLLSSGQQASALAGAALLHELVQRANGRMVVMPGGGIHEANIRQLMEATGAAEYHASARSSSASPMLFRRQNLPMAGAQQLSEYEQLTADASRVQAMQQVLSKESPGKA